VTKAPAAVVAVTATASGQGLETGDVSIALSPKLLDVLERLFGEAQVACGGQKKRASCDINQRFAQRVTEEASPGGAFDFIGPESRALLPLITAGDVALIAGPAAVASPIVLIAVTWVLLGKPPAWTIGSASVAPNGKGDEGDDTCPKDAPKGVDAVGSSFGLTYRNYWLTASSLNVQIVNARAITQNLAKSVHR
jgi:hypothetical protein